MTLAQIRTAAVRPDNEEDGMTSEESASMTAALDELIRFRGPNWEAPEMLDLDAELAAARAWTRKSDPRGGG